MLAQLLVTAGWVRSAEARTWKVPGDRASIQEAVDAAAADDEIRVGPGDHCGAVIDKPLRIRAAEGASDRQRPRIIGCADGPVLFDELRAGFYLPGEAPGAAGSRSEISGFVFDGRAVSDENLSPLAFGVFARFAHDVVVADNHFLGTVQAITNTAGDGWSIRRNHIEGLTLFDCRGERCGGGDGIVVQSASGQEAAEGGPENAFNRPEGTLILGNVVEGQAPEGFTRFKMAGILVLAADATLIFNNRLAIRAGVDDSQAPLAAGVLLDNQRGGSPEPLAPGTQFSGVILNNGLLSDYALLVEGEHGANSDGLLAAGNWGRVRPGR